MKLMNDFFENKLNECNIKRYLPRNSSLANYLPFVLSNNFVFISGQLPITINGIESPGKIKKKIILSLLPFKKDVRFTLKSFFLIKLWSI